MRVFYYFLYGIAILFAVTVQVSFIQPIDTITYGFNIVYIAMLFFLFYHRMYDFLIWTITGSFVLDYFSAWPFGVMMAIFGLVIVIMFFISSLLLTNRSLYALMIFITVGVVVYNTVLYLSLWILKILQLLNHVYSFSYMVTLTIGQIWRVLLIVACLYYVRALFFVIFQKQRLRIL